MLSLERTLDLAKATSVDAEARIELARHEADAILSAARERTELQIQERESSSRATAEAEALAANADAEAAAAQVHAKARRVEDEFVDAALTLVLPAASREATCSSE
ncbi:MAG TPA: hypothetical protein VJ838_03090 [Gaiellaceae bacterium]|nr:hypothetical protein [Gaiellaceae bacterium]